MMRSGQIPAEAAGRPAEHAGTDLGELLRRAFVEAFERAPAEDAQECRARWAAQARLLADTAFVADPAHRPLGAALPPRAAALAANAWDRKRGVTRSDLADVGRLPWWALAVAADRKRLATLVGAVLRAGRLKRSIDGRLLASVAQAIGERALDDVIRLHGARPALEHHAWGADPVGELAALGGEALLACCRCALATRARLALLFAQSRRLAGCDVVALAHACDDAEMIYGGRRPVVDVVDAAMEVAP